MTKRIGLIDVDGHNFPNLALMRLSAWHKAHGDAVEWADPMFGGEYDRIYKSKIFTFTPDDTIPWSCEVIKGGTGYDVRSRLPIEVERSTAMDYSLYPQYEERFEKTISRGIFEGLQEKAKERLAKSNDDESKSGYSLHPEVRKHMESIVNGVVPFGYVIKED